jgi:AcrR family transcriptional regulator
VQQAQYTHDPATDRGRARRDRIISVATDLFHERGFDATGIDEIGQAAGITGPGIYRHFASKDEILIAVLDRIWMMLREGVDAAADLPPNEALELLVDTHVTLAVSHRAEFSLLLRDLRLLPDSYQELARANRRTYRDAWVGALEGVRPDLDRGNAVLMVGAAWRIAAGTAGAMTESGLGANQLVAVLRSMTVQALAGGDGHA